MKPFERDIRRLTNKLADGLVRLFAAELARVTADVKAAAIAARDNEINRQLAVLEEQPDAETTDQADDRSLSDVQGADRRAVPVAGVDAPPAAPLAQDASGDGEASVEPGDDEELDLSKEQRRRTASNRNTGHGVIEEKLRAEGGGDNPARGRVARPINPSPTSDVVDEGSDDDVDAPQEKRARSLSSNSSSRPVRHIASPPSPRGGSAATPIPDEDDEPSPPPAKRDRFAAIQEAAAKRTGVLPKSRTTVTF